MSKKNREVEIITLNGYCNYGNRLQLYALSSIIKQLGFIPVVYWPKSIISRVKDFLKYNTFLKRSYPRDVRLKQFTKGYLPKNSNRLNAPRLIVGSDQVWNPEYLIGEPFLLKIPSNFKSISYAASVGTDRLTKEQQEMFTVALKNYDSISVRECSAKKLLQPLTDKKIEVVLDPTLIINPSSYVALEKRPKNINKEEKYLLSYVLGDNNHKRAIDSFAKENSLRVISIRNRKDSIYGIEEFLYLIHHAEMICTDSFHACVFSFIFERPFIIFKRSGKDNYMYSRIQTLVETFHLENHEFNGRAISRKDILTDYTESKRVLRKKREKSLNYLKNALGEN